jgi:5'-deoxynucleotidase YfbR-like HD superfamily hydrolase
VTLNMQEMLTGKARTVAHVTRFAGIPLHRTENVAEHSYMTAQYAMFIGLECIRLGGAVDMGKLLTRALVHDLDEAIMVDLPRPLKYRDPVLLARWQDMSREAVLQMEMALGVPFFVAWSRAKDHSLEGRILALADLISVTSYVIEELRFGNSFMLPVLKGNIDYLMEFYNKEGTTEIRGLTLAALNVAAAVYLEMSGAPVNQDLVKLWEAQLLI